VTDFEPTPNFKVEKVAVPLLIVPVPRAFVPCLNLTVSPSGGEPILELTVAEKSTD
jgi:hypothetical protein